MPISAVIGLLSTAAIWLIILITEEYSRWVGLGWILFGLVIYYFYRRRRRKPSDEWQVKKGDIK